MDVAEAHDAEDALADKDPFGVGISGVVGRERIEGIAPVAVPRGVGDRAGGAAGRVGRNLREAAGTSDARVELDLRDAGTDGGRDSERVSLSSSGTVAAPIDFTAVPGQNVTLTGGTNGFYTNGKSYVTIQGFTVSGTTQDAIVVSRNSSHITVRGNRVTNAGQPVSGLTARGIRVDITNDNAIANNTVDHNTDYGIYVVGGSTRNEITGNRVFSNARSFERAASGIRIHDSAGNTISGNFSHDNEDSGIELVTGSPNNFVINNVVYNNGDHGIDNTGNSPNNSVIGNAVYNSMTSEINFEGRRDRLGRLQQHRGRQRHQQPAHEGQHPRRLDVDDGHDVGLQRRRPERPRAQLRVGHRLRHAVADAGRHRAGAHGIQADPKWTSPATADFELQQRSPAIDSANSAIAGAQSTDAQDNSRIDDPLTANTGVGPRPYDDRGPLEYEPHDQAPLAALTVTPPTGAINLDVTADASASVDNDGLSPIASYRFDFGDGSSTVGPQTTATATHTYRDPGTYTVTVTVTDTGGLSSTATSTVTVRDDAPAAAVSLLPASGPVPLTTTADASGSTDTDAAPIASYSFDWGDGSAPSGAQSSPQASHSYTERGTYTVTVTVRDSAGRRRRTLRRSPSSTATCRRPLRCRCRPPAAT